MTAEDKDKGTDLPWVFRKGAPVAAGQGVDWDPASALYRLFGNTRNPYLQRALAPAPPKLERTASELQRLFRLMQEDQRYRVAPPNTEEPYRRRRLDHAMPAAPVSPKFQDPAALPGDPVRLPSMIDGFFQSVLKRLHENPDLFFDVIDELTELFRRGGIRVRVAEAFRALEDWDDLLETLEEIARFPAPETFDLFCSALLAYHELVQPERS
jgi:hypothetical protein